MHEYEKLVQLDANTLEEVIDSNTTYDYIWTELRTEGI